MKAAHSALLSLLAWLAAWGPGLLPDAEAAAPPSGDPVEALSRRLAPIARDVQALEQLQAEQLFWINVLDQLARNKPDTAWFTRLSPPAKPGMEARVVPPGSITGPPRIGPTRAAEHAVPTGPHLEALLRVPDDPRPEAALAKAVEALRKTLVTDDGLAEDAMVLLFEPIQKRPGMGRAVYVVDLKLPRMAATEPPDGPSPSPAQIETAYANLKKLLLTWRDDSVYDPKRAPRQPVLFLGELQDTRGRVRAFAQVGSVKLNAGVEDLGFQELASDTPPAEVTLDMLKERSAVRDILILLINRNVESIESIEHLGPAEGADGLYRKLRFRVTFRAKWPALAQFMLDLVNKGKVAVGSEGDLPRNLLVIEEMSYLADEPVARDKPARPAAGFGGAQPSPRPKTNIPGRFPDYNVLTVTMTIAMVDFSERITGPTPGRDTKAAETDEASGADDEPPLAGKVDPRALAHRIALLAESIDGGGGPDGFVRRDPTSDPRRVMPQPGEVACELCGYIRPADMARCPVCGPPPTDDDADGMPGDWEDRHKGTDSAKPDADADPDGDGFTNLREYRAGTDPDDPKSIPSPLHATAVYKAPVELLFRGYAIKEGGSADKIDPAFWTIQLAYGDATTQFVQLGGTWRGYTLVSLEKHVGPIQPPGGGRPVQGEVYELTLQRPGEEPIKLVKGTPKKITDTLVDMTVVAGTDAGKDLNELTLGSTVQANGKTFRITKIADGLVGVETVDGTAFELRPLTWLPKPVEPPPDADKDGMSDDWENAFDGADSTEHDADADPDGDGFTNLREYIGGSDPDDPKSLPSPFKLMELYRKPVDVLFRGYTINDGGNPAVIDPEFWVLSMNYGRDSLSGFVPLSGWWHGYKLGPLEKNKVRRTPGRGIPDYVEVVYALTIRRRGEEPIRLVRGKWAKINETYVDLAVTRGRDKGKTFQAATIGETIAVDGVRYMITQVGAASVLIEDDAGTAYLLPLQR